jgi:hypothetical protein
MVFSNEEADAARQELGPDIFIIHIQPMSAPDRHVVPNDYKGKDYAWRKKADQYNHEAMP